MSDDVLPQRKMPKLIVVMAFDKDDDGNLLTAFGPADQRTEERAVTLARSLADKHVGVIAWSREANPDLGEYGPPTTLFTAGDVPDME
ncbi:hypothetical protein ASD64_16380 [Mesorhizobium sp. Root157]|uniref:hypothetical protein n=1 Tax=Mesorhizobium sp. Root157 TaxID=1736477 RepID=UPI0006F3C4AD|nr:hypothetical protein [Mesorhizobium sp. Root157]KQZ97784.1 hypothetical protein ASD64_16380 [Mesorhizobium sp. Root157]